MPTYQVNLLRSYVVEINAPNQKMAARLAEFYVGTGADESSDLDRSKFRFQIQDIEMVQNDAMEVSPIGK